MRRQASTLVTAKHHANLCLLQFLSTRFTYLEKDKWKEQISMARVLVNRKPASAKTCLQLGDEVTFICHDLPEPPVDKSYKIIHEDADLLVIDKPATLPCHPKGRYFHHTLWALLKEKRKDQYFTFVNRIDRETSGIVLIGKNKKASRNCQQQFISHQVGKEYLAIIIGLFPRRISCRGYLVNDCRSSIKHKMRFMDIAADRKSAEEGKIVHTNFRLLRPVGRYSLILAKPNSGRRHQIRASLTAINFPLLGDKLYGTNESLFFRFIKDRLSEADKDYLVMKRQALHASRLTIRHPTGGQKLSFYATLPDDLKIFLQKSKRDSDPL
ncbi:MAG: RluA family pseudouridine synthase [Deltaproteobacteria bacterium]